MAWISTPRGLYGESGIRTHGTLASTHAFQACTLGHSVISPSSTDGARANAYMDVQSVRPGRHNGRSAVVAWHGRRTCPTGTPVRTSDHQDSESTPDSRREWDSNPRSRKRLNGFRDRPIRPLSHLSKPTDGRRTSAYRDVQADVQSATDGVRSASPLTAKTPPRNADAPNTRSPAAPSGRGRPISSCPRGFEPPTFRSAV